MPANIPISIPISPTPTPTPTPPALPDPQPPNTEVVHTQTQIIRDVSGITGTDSAANTARLISQFGLPTTVLAVFLTLFIGVLWWVFTDFQTRQKETTESHERSIKAIVDAHKEVYVAEREDNREREKATRESQTRVWGQLRDITNATQESNRTLQKATDIMATSHELLTKQLVELRKMTKNME